jgi:chorismate-pyruvate lyase
MGSLPLNGRTLKTRRGRMMSIALGCVLLQATIARGEATSTVPSWTENFVTRLQAQALLATLNSELLSHESATLTLERWCEVHRLASPAKITAERVHDADKRPSQEQRDQLAVSPAEVIRYRRVRLSCGAVLLSEADNWYVPSRLTPEMNRLLDTTDTPFGKVVAALHFQRHTLTSRLLWSPLPADWEMNSTALSEAPKTVPESVLEHRALLSLPAGIPISEVVETYKSGVLAFPIKRH